MQERQILKVIFFQVFSFIGNFRIFFAVFLLFTTHRALGAYLETLYNGSSLEVLSLQTALSQVQAGTIVILGEQHAQSAHQAQQIKIIENIKKNNKLVSIGMEFFSYPDQDLVDTWQFGGLSDPEFLTKISWGQGFSFSYYRDQVKTAQPGRERILALNAPRSLTGKIAKMGLSSLSPVEQQLLPPHFELGNSRYFERFKASIGHLPNPNAADNYFAAQSVWDDTMAWKAVDFIQNNPQHVLVIIVGEFHLQYGGGLPARIKARGVSQVLSFSLMNLEGLSSFEERLVLEPSSLEGPRADYIWTSRP